ncbi:3-demethylubiquinone-9 3-methyltransferase [Desulfurispirillum indicum S5]|uniref:3-demethylubiquinone-9 3-methyltransferase n=1 Tax=Desulfurispirillum indicum (strain ATCC BAA-1389 / DSM 22839 / S5) TaxID=653733 RepID=E6W1H5_DESIS|nr:VOC family protein [Desulfurispirillum indicum]ADU65431.1 3-demethylubiquinone-9 3-methyltransferase [Desulfurispirillum indicum S5]
MITTTQQKIVPQLWFDKEAKEAAEFYCSIFPDASIISSTTLHGTPSGDVETVSFEISGYAFAAISAGPHFRFNPSISFLLNFDPSQNPQASQQLDTLWNALSDGGTALMPLGSYPFSQRYGWIQDRYGLSWQLMLTDPEGEERPFITPMLLFTGDMCGKAEEASDFYLSIFHHTRRGIVARHPAGAEPDQAGTIMFTDFMLENQWFSAMDSAHEHSFTFNEAISLLVYCDTQQQIDAHWEKLSAVPEVEQCGWLKDRYGLSWQIVPRALDAMLQDPAKQDQITQAFLAMKKLDVDELRRLYGEG